MSKYDTEEFDPPAPTLKVRISVPDYSESLRDAILHDGFMLIDTGADIGCVPKRIIRQLELSRGYMLPYTDVSIQGVNGASETYNAYMLIIDAEGLGKTIEAELVAMDNESFIIGRDVINQFRILFDGPQSIWNLAP